MTTFALTLLPAREQLQTFVYGVFIFYVLVSFVCVAGYAAGQLQAGRLVNNGAGPRPFVVKGMSGWLFIASVVALIYLQSILYILLVLVGAAGVLMENGTTAAEQYGLTRLDPAKLVRWSLLILGAVVLVETPLTSVTEWLLDALHLPHPEQESVETFRRFTKVSTIAGFLFQAVFFYPVIEELFFRGFLLTFLKNYTSTWLALVLSAGVFAFAHVNLGAVLPLWFLGLVLGLAYEHTGCLLLPMGIHACWNLVTALSLLLDKGSG